MKKADMLEALRNSKVSLKTLVYGSPGSGKTWYEGTFPRPFVFDFDDGAITLVGATNPDIEWETYKASEGPDIWPKFERLFMHTLKRDDIDTVCIDSITTLSDYILWFYKKLDGNWPSGRKVPPKIQDYQRLITHLKDFFYQVTQQCVESGKHIVVTAHERIITTESPTQAIVSVPLVTGQHLPQQMPLWFDEVYYAFAKGPKANVRHMLRTVQTSSTLGKSRLSAFCPIAPEEPNDFNVIWQKVQEGLENPKSREEPNEED